MTFVRPIITLTQAQMDLADDVDRRRNELARKFGRQHGNNGNVSPALQSRGVRCELAAKIYLDPVIWHDVSVDQYLEHAPDLEGGSIKIDVKGIGHPDHQLVAYKIVPDWAYLLVLSDDYGFWMRGWLPGKLLAQMPVIELQPGRPAHCALSSQLRDPAHLRNAVYADLARP
jgi:hypothetical protein